MYTEKKKKKEKNQNIHPPITQSKIHDTDQRRKKWMKSRFIQLLAKSRAIYEAKKSR